MNEETKPIALVTGVGSSVGAAIVKHLAAQGFVPVIHYFHDTAKAQSVIERVQKLQPLTSSVQADLTRTESARTLVQHIQTTYGRLDLVVHTVGDFLSSPLLETTPADWHRIVDTNMTSALLLAQATIPLMRTQGKGRIIFFGAAHAERATARPRTTAYMLAKYGVHTLTQQLALECATDNITIACIAPNVLENTIFPLSTPTGETVSYEAVLNTIDYLRSAPHASVNGTIITLSDGWLPKSL